MEQVGYLLKEHLDVVLNNEIYDDGIDVYTVAFLLINKNGELLDFGYKADENGNELTTEEYKDSKKVLKRKLKQLVEKVHNNGEGEGKKKKVVISVGGHPDFVPGKYWNTLISDAKKIHKFINRLNLFIVEYDLDGIDIDCETPTLCNYGKYLTFMELMCDYFRAGKNKILSAAISASPYHLFGNLGQWILRHKTVYSYVSYANVMAYDFPTSCCIKNFAKVGFAKFSIHTLNSICDVSKNKQRLGIPLYGRNGGKTMDYNLLLKKKDKEGKGANPEVDKNYEGFYYTTFGFLRKKVDFARRETGGTMYWSLKMDTKRENPKSLLRKVDDYLEIPLKPKKKNCFCCCNCCWFFSIFCCFPNCSK